MVQVGFSMNTIRKILRRKRDNGALMRSKQTVSYIYDNATEETKNLKSQMSYVYIKEKYSYENFVIRSPITWRNFISNPSSNGSSWWRTDACHSISYQRDAV